MPVGRYPPGPDEGSTWEQGPSMLQSWGRSTSLQSVSANSGRCAPFGSPRVKRQPKSTVSRDLGTTSPTGGAASTDSAWPTQGATERAATPWAVRRSRSRRVSKVGESPVLAVMDAFPSSASRRALRPEVLNASRTAEESDPSRSTCVQEELRGGRARAAMRSPPPGFDPSPADASGLH